MIDFLSNFISKLSHSHTTEKEKEDDTCTNVAVGHATAEVTHRYGTATVEDYVGYTGKRVNADGSVTQYQKSHSGIHTHKINPEYAEQNISQQAGFNAEVNYATQENKKRIIAGSKERVSRTDDLVDSHGAKRINDTVADVTTLDEFGNIVPYSEGQMKFVKNPHGVCDKIAMGKGGGKNDLSRYQKNELLLPTDQVETTKAHCLEKAQQLRKQALYNQEKNPELAQEKLKQAENFEELSQNIKSAGFTIEEAKAYRLNPVLETAKSIAGTAHNAGLEGAKYGAAIGGVICVASNTFAVCQGDKEIGEAVVDCAKGTVKAAAMGYATTATGSFLKGAMEQAPVLFSQQSMRGVTQCAHSLSKTNLPALAVTICIEFSGLVKQYARGEIDAVEFMEKAGEKGVGLSASTAMGAIGQIAIPIPGVGMIVGSMIGYTLSSMFYNEALNAFKGAKEAHKNYLLVKARYEEFKRQRDIYKANMQKQFEEHMAEQITITRQTFQNIDKALEVGNMNEFVQQINFMGDKLFNKDLCFKSQAEFDDFMLSDESLKL